MKVRNGKEIVEFRTNAKLNFCHPVQKEKKKDPKGEEIEFTNCQTLFRVSINRIPL